MRFPGRGWHGPTDAAELAGPPGSEGGSWRSECGRASGFDRRRGTRATQAGWTHANARDSASGGLPRLRIAHAQAGACKVTASMFRAIPERVPSLGPGEDSARAGCEGGRAKRLQRIRLCSATRMLVATDRFGGSSSDSDWVSFPAGYPACRGAGGGGCCAFRAQGWIRVRAGRRRWCGGCGTAGRWDRLGQGDGRTVAALVSGSRGSSRAATAAHGSELNQRLPESLFRPARDGGPPAGLLGLVIPSREFERPHVRNVGTGTNTTSRRNLEIGSILPPSADYRHCMTTRLHVRNISWIMDDSSFMDIVHLCSLCLLVTSSLQTNGKILKTGSCCRSSAGGGLSASPKVSLTASFSRNLLTNDFLHHHGLVQIPNRL